ncbi:MAG: MBL fold metallo-hydrolase [Nocardioides sp.]
MSCTPGHAPGAVCLTLEDHGCIFTGDTLFRGGPGRPAGRSATARPSSAPSGSGCSRCPTRPSCTPDTAPTPPSALSGPAWAEVGVSRVTAIR